MLVVKLLCATKGVRMGEITNPNVCDLAHIYRKCNNLTVGPDVKGGSVVLPDPRPGSTTEYPYPGTSPIGGGAFSLFRLPARRRPPITCPVRVEARVERGGVLDADPEPILTPPPAVGHATIGRDHPAGRFVVQIVGEQNSVDAKPGDTPRARPPASGSHNPAGTTGRPRDIRHGRRLRQVRASTRAGRPASPGSTHRRRTRNRRGHSHRVRTPRRTARTRRSPRWPAPTIRSVCRLCTRRCDDSRPATQ